MVISVTMPEKLPGWESKVSIIASFGACNDGPYIGMMSEDQHAMLMITQAKNPPQSIIPYLNSTGSRSQVQFSAHALVGSVSTGNAAVGGEVFPGNQDIGRPETGADLQLKASRPDNEVNNSNNPALFLPVYYRAGMNSSAWDDNSVSSTVPFYMNVGLAIIWDGTGSSDISRYLPGANAFQACIATSNAAGDDTCGTGQGAPQVQVPSPQLITPQFIDVVDQDCQPYTGHMKNCTTELQVTDSKKRPLPGQLVSFSHSIVGTVLFDSENPATTDKNGKVFISARTSQDPAGSITACTAENICTTF